MVKQIRKVTSIIDLSQDAEEAIWKQVDDSICTSLQGGGPKTPRIGEKRHGGIWRKLSTEISFQFQHYQENGQGYYGGNPLQ